MDKQADINLSVLNAAEDAIKNNEHRERLLVEVWENLDLPTEVVDLVFCRAEPTIAHVAEQELLEQVARKRGMEPQSVEEGSRPRRPVGMRGTLI